MLNLLETVTQLNPEEAYEEITAFNRWLSELPIKLLNKLPSIIGATIVIVIGFFFTKFIGKLLIKIMVKNHVDESVHHFLRNIVVITLRIICVLFALGVLGVDVNSFAAAIGGAGITAGLGLQSSIAQFASGIEIMFNKPFKSGDFIEIDGISGKVEEIHFMHTNLLTADNRRVIIPNSHVTSGKLINYTAQKTRRLDLQFSISYSDDFNKAKAVIAQCNDECEYTIAQPKPRIAISKHAESCIVIDTLLWCNNEDYWDAYYDMNERVKKAFDAAGINIPFNQMDVHIINE